MKARVSNLTKTEAEWLALDFKPLAGELIVYAPDAAVKYPRIKIGNGIDRLHDLPFVIESVTEELLAAYNKQELADAGRITYYIK